MWSSRKVEGEIPIPLSFLHDTTAPLTRDCRPQEDVKDMDKVEYLRNLSEFILKVLQKQYEKLMYIFLLVFVHVKCSTSLY